MTDQAIISFENVRVQHLDQILLDNITFKVNPGEQWAVIGASGSGKSALLKAITGKLHISKGIFTHSLLSEKAKKENSSQVLFNWKNLISSVSAKHNFTNLSNTTNFYYQQRFNSSDSEDTQTVEEYLNLVKPLTAHVPWTLERVIDRLNLKTLRNKHLIKLSNGETKRLLIAKALLKNPTLLLLDNPLTGLDIDSRSDINKLITEISDSGISIIMATSPFEIPEAITHIINLDQGKISKILTQSEFNPEDLHFSNQTNIDTKELQDLLAISKQENFKNIVKMKDVVIKYGDNTIIDHVNWTIKQGERWALLGHNGAGKSTLLSLINGDNPQAYANNISLFDVKRGSGESIWEIKKKIGFVSPEFFQYFPNTNSCLQVIESGFYDTLGLFRKSNPDKVKIAKRWMQLLEIEDSANKRFKNSSASTQRLCLLARALVKNPPLLIFDEPTQGLDSHQQQNFKHIIEKICEHSQVSLIYVSHYNHEIPKSVKNILKLEKGKQIQNVEV
ncbi:ATP-binding cassette domain-containing protein [Ancylomarina sp. 16SWW S1-10-2]|uniref:ATP-binding cassette domain-containing protein n=1 Tax=Ancylomarina sp. 16SWW S1-10-2 TaxID=2499681 RepID=UPI0012AE967E|nr:ATP-binding cassette domain-containing protein [Ancylomarina sp. 16SWW S1-10-2]MRT93952.1 ATP-binding cassette domain-containing protein [Ancylomarina sp. 16SWW S1-10-2]